MSYSARDQQRVFLVYRTVFAGPSALIRKAKKVREVVQQHRYKPAFQPIVHDFGFEKVCEIVKLLLEEQIFESALKAKIAFPQLFQISQARDVQHTASEADIARSEAEALEEIASANDVDSEFEDEIKEDLRDDPKADGVANVGLPPPATVPILATTKTPSLYPLHLPFKTQHLILTTTQHLLEECCFDFAVTWLPSLLTENDWDCAEAVELTKWTKTLKNHFPNLPASAVNSPHGGLVQEIFHATNELRHSAVHRLPTSARGIHKLIQSALRLAKLLCDFSRAAVLEDLDVEIERRIRDMELNKNFLEDRLDKQLQDIQEQRAELDRKEQEAIATMLREDQENKALIGSFLDTSIKNTFHMDKKGSEDSRPEDKENFAEGNGTESSNNYIPDREFDRNDEENGGLGSKSEIGVLNTSI